MKFLSAFFLLIISAGFPAYGSTFSDNDFPFQHDNLGTSSSSDGEERITHDYDEPEKWKHTAADVHKEVFRIECEGIKMDEDCPFNYAQSTVLRVSAFYRAKLRWIIRRLGSDYAFPIFVRCYMPQDLTEGDQKRLDNLRIAFPDCIASMVKRLTNSYVTWYLCSKSFSEVTLLNLVTNEMPEFSSRRVLPKSFFNKDMPLFVSSFCPQLKDAGQLLTRPSDEAYTWILYAYEKACIYFMRDFAKALIEYRDRPAVSRAPFQNLNVQTIVELYREVKPQFKKGYKPREDPTSSTNGFHIYRLELREKMQAGIVPTMGDIMRWGVTCYALEPSQPAPDEPEADDEDVNRPTADISDED